MSRVRVSRLLGILVFGAVCVSAARAERGVAGSPAAAAVAESDLVDAVNALAQADIGIAAAAHTACVLDRLPATRAALLPQLPADHRRLIGECARGRMRISRRMRDFDLLGLIDDPAEHPAAAAAVRAFFATRTVDVIRGSGLSDGPYPIRFDWVLVLDPGSRTLMSFVLNCRD